MKLSDLSKLIFLLIFIFEIKHFLCRKEVDIWDNKKKKMQMKK